jgi:hypothetical protein
MRSSRKMPSSSESMVLRRVLPVTDLPCVPLDVACPGVVMRMRDEWVRSPHALGISVLMTGSDATTTASVRSTTVHASKLVYPSVMV